MHSEDQFYTELEKWVKKWRELDEKYRLRTPSIQGLPQEEFERRVSVWESESRIIARQKDIHAAGANHWELVDLYLRIK